MKKYLLLLILLLIPSALAIQECQSFMNNNQVPCLIFIPNISTGQFCENINITMSLNNTLKYSQSLGNFNNYLCNSTFNQTTFGTYNFLYSTGDSGSITIQEDVNNRYYLYIVSFITWFILLGLGYYLEDRTFAIISGMLVIVIAINIYTNGFPNLTNVFLVNGIVTVLAGIGMYYTIYPTVKYFEENY
jgi:hypothetical protein